MNLSNLKLWWFAAPLAVIMVMIVGSRRYRKSNFKVGVVKVFSRRYMRAYAVISAIIVGALLYFESFDDILRILANIIPASLNHPQIAVIVAIVLVCFLFEEILYVICGLSGRSKKHRLMRKIDQNY